MVLHFRADLIKKFQDEGYSVSVATLDNTYAEQISDLKVDFYCVFTLNYGVCDVKLVGSVHIVALADLFFVNVDLAYRVKTVAVKEDLASVGGKIEGSCKIEIVFEDLRCLKLVHSVIGVVHQTAV